MSQVTIEQALQIAMEHHRSGRLAEAQDLYQRILAKQQDHAPSLHYLGVIALQMGQSKTAADFIRRALTINPSDPEAHNNLGIILKESGQLSNALLEYNEAVRLNPNYAEAHNNLGNVLAMQGQILQAIAAYRQAIVLKSNYVTAYNNLADALRVSGQLAEALTACHQAIALDSNSAAAHVNLGNIMAAKGQLADAAAAYRRAIELQPDFPDAHNNLAGVLKDMGLPEEAIAAYRKALSLNPNLPAIHSNLVYATHFHPAYSAQMIAEEHRLWNTRHAQPYKQFVHPHSNNRDPQRQLRIGYVSPDFREHPVGRFLVPVVACHDKRQVKLFAYTLSPISDIITHWLQAHMDVWRSLVGISDAQAADLIRQDEIDILVDLTLHMAGNRLPLFARKPAPIQVSWLGYPGSTGLATIDYRISDPYLEQDTEAELHDAEKAIRLPNSFWCYDPLDGRDVPTNSLPSLTTGFITFGCLNSFSKVNTTAVALWAVVLREVQNSRLLLLANNPIDVQHTVAQLSREGIDPARLEFLPRRSQKEYLQYYHRIDLGLDTIPYNGHTTTFDSLWMGVPIVTLIGETAVGRGGFSILSNLGLPELAAHSQEEYVRIAINLSHDPARLAELRTTLRPLMEQSPLMDAPRFARNIESAYRQMWRTWCATPQAADNDPPIR